MEGLDVVREAGATGSTKIVRLKGALTLSTSLLLEEKLSELRSGDTVIDVTEVDYIDSSGLGAILSHWASTQRTGHQFAVTGANARVDVLLTVTGLKTVIPTFKTAEEADARFMQKA